MRDFDNLLGELSVCVLRGGKSVESGYPSFFRSRRGSQFGNGIGRREDLLPHQRGCDGRRKGVLGIGTCVHIDGITFDDTLRCLVDIIKNGMRIGHRVHNRLLSRREGVDFSIRVDSEHDGSVRGMR